MSGLTSFSFGSWRPIVHEHQPLSSSLDSSVTANGPAAITPDIISKIYQSNYTDKAPLGSQAVIEYGTTANFNEADLQTFFKGYAFNLVGNLILRTMELEYLYNSWYLKKYSRLFGKNCI